MHPLMNDTRQAMRQASDIAREQGQDRIGPEHLLLALTTDLRSEACHLLADHGVRYDEAYARLQAFDQAHPERAETPAAEEEAPVDDYAADREALAAIGIDLDRVREAVARNLGADLTKGWGERPHRGGRRGRGADRGPRGPRGPYGRGRRGPRRGDRSRLTAATREVLDRLREDAIASRLELHEELRDRRDGADRRAAVEAFRAELGGQRRLLAALLDSEDPAVAAVLGDADREALRTELTS